MLYLPGFVTHANTQNLPHFRAFPAGIQEHSPQKCLFFNANAELPNRPGFALLHGGVPRRRVPRRGRVCNSWLGVFSLRGNLLLRESVLQFDASLAIATPAWRIAESGTKFGEIWDLSYYCTRGTRLSGRTLQGVLSTFWEPPFSEPLLRTLLRTFFPFQTCYKTPSKNPSKNLLQRPSQNLRTPDSHLLKGPGCSINTTTIETTMSY